MLEASPRPTRIYVLIDPETHAVRYVGKTLGSLAARFSLHLKEARDGNRTHRSNWIRSLLKKGLQPAAQEVEVVGENWAERERFWIAFHRQSGSPLTNICAGGEGAPGAVRSAEWRANQASLMSARMKKATSTPEGKARCAGNLAATMSDPEWRKRQSARVKEWQARPEVAEAQAAYWNEGNRAAQAARTASQWTPERRAAMSAQSKALRTPEREAARIAKLQATCAARNAAKAAAAQAQE